ncbi:MAG: dockerin type I repeat-containing protein [Dehalococcoidia bacterium]
MRLLLLVLFTASLGVALLSAPPRASAQDPDLGVSFRLAVDTDGDGIAACSTTGGPSTCTLRRDSQFGVDVFLDSLPPELSEYGGFEVELRGSGGIISGEGAVAWPDGICIAEDRNQGPGKPHRFGCSVMNFGERSTYVGLMATGFFRCTGDGMVHQEFAELADPSGQGYSLEGSTLDIRCLPPGDANCDNTANTLDATLILQYHARLIPNLACLSVADVNADGRVNSIDAYLLLFFTASPILPLPPP